MSRPPDDTHQTADDAVLSAYLDAELPQADADRLTARLAADPALSRRLEEMQSANRAARRAFEVVDDRPLPQGVLDLLEDANARQTGDKEQTGRVVQFPPSGPRHYLQVPVALAASVALAAGFLLGDLVRRAPGTDADITALYAGAIPEDSEIHRVLESGVSTEPEELASGAEARLLLTFENEQGDWCRQLQLAAESGSMQALACRRDGTWRMEAAAFGTVPDSASEAEYQAASRASFPALDAAIEAQIGARPPLSPEEESRLISNDWKKSGGSME